MLSDMELKKDFYWAGVLDPSLRVFDIIMQTEFGTTYNSYVLKGSEKTAVFETAKGKYADAYLKELSKVVAPDRIDYVIVDHTEPDHTGSLEVLLRQNPNLQVVGTAVAIQYLKNIVNREFRSVAVKDGDTLSLGNKTLRFLVLPNLHWPDSMYTYVEEDGTLITCDSFGAHYSHPGILRSTVTDTEGYLRAAKYYFDNILGPFKQPFMARALDRIKPLHIDMICPGHGPVLDGKYVAEIQAIYETWVKPEAPRAQKQVVIPYVSAYGYTGMLAEAIAEGIRKSGDVQVTLYDMVESDENTVAEAIASADGFLLGSPTILGDALPPIRKLLTSLFPPLCKGKPAGAFGSYGWSGEAVPNLTEQMKLLKLNVCEGFRVKFKPSDEELAAAENFGSAFAALLK